MAALLAGCDALSPPPSVPHPPTLTWGDERLLVFAELAQPCEERLAAITDLGPCERKHTAQGVEVRCKMAPPLSELVFGCGPDLEQPAERLRIVPDPDDLAAGGRLAAAMTQHMGVCVPEGATAERGSGSLPATRFCFFARSPAGSALPGGLRGFTEGSARFPQGVFLRWPVGPSTTPPQSAVDAPPAALVVETDLLDAAERRQVVAALRDLLGIALR